MLDPRTLFDLGNLVVMPFWLLYLVAPRWRVTRQLARWMPGVVLVALAYAWLVVPMLPETLPLVLNPKLDLLLPALSTPIGFTVLWLHILVMDLLAGTWVYQRAQARGQHHAVTAPILLLTLLMGPLGVVLYWLTERMSGAPWGSRTE